MASASEYSSFELMAAAGARELQDGEIVAVGLGLPVVACFLAKQTHAPNISIILELGVVDPEPVEIGDGLSDPRFWYRAKALTSFVDMLGMTLHRGLVDVGFLGGLEVDAYGNLNTTQLSDPRGKFRRFTGSGGGNDIASSARRTVITIRHEARKLTEAVSFITSPGYLAGSGDREKAGLIGGPSVVITDKAVLDFDEDSRRMRVRSVHPDTTVEDVLANMAFKPVVPDGVGHTEAPTKEEVRLIREVIDPEGMYRG